MLRAVIIDDEIAAINALKLLIKRHIEDVEVVAFSTEGEQAIAMIEEQQPDIVFLDISMPDMSGFSLLKRLKYKSFHLVFASAHERYAIQAIKHHPADYLLKPIDIDELRFAIDNIKKAREINTAQKTLNPSIQKKLKLTSKIALPVKEGTVYLTVSEIIWIGSDGNYCTFYAKGAKKYLVSKNIGEYEDILPEKKFFRAHKSHLINIKKVKKYIRTDGYFVEMEDGSVLEVARRKKDEFLQVMNDLN